MLVNVPATKKSPFGPGTIFWTYTVKEAPWKIGAKVGTTLPGPSSSAAACEACPRIMKIIPNAAKSQPSMAFSCQRTFQMFWQNLVAAETEQKRFRFLTFWAFDSESIIGKVEGTYSVVSVGARAARSSASHASREIHDKRPPRFCALALARWSRRKCFRNVSRNERNLPRVSCK